MEVFLFLWVLVRRPAACQSHDCRLTANSIWSETKSVAGHDRPWPNKVRVRPSDSTPFYFCNDSIRTQAHKHCVCIKIIWRSSGSPLVSHLRSISPIFLPFCTFAFLILILISLPPCAMHLMDKDEDEHREDCRKKTRALTVSRCVVSFCSSNTDPGTGPEHGALKDWR